ncbi:hypothetical protein C0J52_09575 [Blattella germanica]|nr:hypothetical protein C0J52_09575 [Blattella germanica]
MSREATMNVPPGLVKSLTSQWESNSGELENGEMEQKNNVSQLNNRALQEILRSMCGGVEMFNFKELFKKEVLMYSTVIPALKDIYKNDPMQMFPICHHTSNDVIILENLLSYGYRSVDLETGLDAAHCKLVLTELGRFHAAAHVLLSSGSGDDLKTAGKEVQYSEERSSLYKEYFKDRAESMVGIIKTNPEASRYTNNVKEILNNTYENLLKCLKFKGHFLTLTLGNFSITMKYPFESNSSISILAVLGLRHLT